jgi:predicted phosphohydrolase
MKVFAISDLHLSINCPKPMDIFGPVWDNYLTEIENDWNEKVSDEDIVLISGDISWAMKFEEAKSDLDYICKLKGHKVIIKGNHDYWWSSISEIRGYLYNNTYALQNDAIKIGNCVICGSRGWSVLEDNEKTEQDEKIYRRELIRMELSLKSMKAKRTAEDKAIVMTHFPPFNYNLDDNSMTELFEEYGVNAVVFGHLHSYDKKQKLEFIKGGIPYYLTSCDLRSNKLVEICEI